MATGPTNDRIIFDRCDIHGLDYPGRVGRGLYLNGSNVALIHSRVHKINRWGEGTDAVTGLEAAAVDISTGPGPGTLEDNLLEAIGITVFFPDASKHYFPPADYVIRGNLFLIPTRICSGRRKTGQERIIPTGRSSNSKLAGACSWKATFSMEIGRT